MKIFLLLFSLLFMQIPKGATFVKVDKIDLKKDNSPALVFHGVHDTEFFLI